MTTVLGDLLDMADQHIGAATLSIISIPPDARPGVITALHAVTTALARHAANPTLPDSFNPGADGLAASGQPEPLDTKLALINASADMTIAAHTCTAPSADPAHPTESHLRAAADCLTASHDLLRTHFPGRTAHPTVNGSAWAAVIASPPVASALFSQLASYTMQLAPLATALALPTPNSPALPAPTAQSLRSASSWLQVAALASAPRQQAQTSAGQLLRSVPANLPPRRELPPDGAPILDLCAGIIRTAERLRHLTIRAAHDHWPPAATSLCWRRNALAAAILSHTSGIILHTLADRAAHLSPGTGLTAHLADAATACQPACTAWQSIASAWDVMTTGPSHTLSPVTIALGDLVLWTGRLARSAPDWTPARGNTSPPRDPADLAPSPDDLRIVLTAISRVTDTITRIAKHDDHAVRHATHENALYIPARLLPERSNTRYTYRYDRPTSGSVTGLLATYRTATKTSRHTNDSIRAILTSNGTPHASPPAPRIAGQDQPGRSSPENQTRTEPKAFPRPPRRPDELQHLLHTLEITEPELILRATAIDHATCELDAQARQRTSRRATVTTAIAKEPAR